MEQLHFYSTDEEIEVGGIDFTCEVEASASYQFIPPSHDDPADEVWVGEESEVLSAHYYVEDNSLMSGIKNFFIRTIINIRKLFTENNLEWYRKFNTEIKIQADKNMLGELTAMLDTQELLKTTI